MHLRSLAAALLLLLVVAQPARADLTGTVWHSTTRTYAQAFSHGAFYNRAGDGAWNGGPRVVAYAETRSGYCALLNPLAWVAGLLLVQFGHADDLTLTTCSCVCYAYFPLVRTESFTRYQTGWEPDPVDPSHPALHQAGQYRLTVEALLIAR